MKPADYWVQLTDQVVRCCLCPHACQIPPGRRGICGVRENRGGTLFSLVYGRLVSANVDPIEKKPLFHFLPGTHSFSIATRGCNFSCRHCQNSTISQVSLDRAWSNGCKNVLPEEVVASAVARQCRSISYTYVEPTIFFEFAHDTALLGHQAGLANVFVTNGYMSSQACDTAVLWLDAANIDLKSYRDAWYRRVCGGSLQPVLETIVRMKAAGIWVEVTTLVIPGENDSDQELSDIARFIASVDCDMPWHVSRFHPAHRMMDRDPTPVATLTRAREIGVAAGLRYVYQGNMPGGGGADSRCPACGKVVMSRQGFRVLENALRVEGDGTGHCRHCGTLVSGVYAWHRSPDTTDSLESPAAQRGRLHKLDMT